MNLEALKEAVSRIEAVGEHVDYVVGVAKPCARLMVGDGPGTEAGSRFGGHPYVPEDFSWPIHDVGQYRFLGQIDFADIAQRPSALPDSGLLTLFYADDEVGDVFWQDDGYVLGFYWPTTDGHALFDSPVDDVPEPLGIRATGGVGIPQFEELRTDWPFDRDVIAELADHLGPDENYLLGYPSFTSLAYDPTPEGDWISLLTLDSLGTLNWCWHDGDKLMVFIEPSKLADCDFGHLKSDAG
jgi:uncharacterized protein YwqG